MYRRAAIAARGCMLRGGCAPLVAAATPSASSFVPVAAIACGRSVPVSVERLQRRCASGSTAPTTLFTREHEYARLDASNGSKATVGITTFAQSLLGDVVFVQLPIVGQNFTKGQTIATVESVKATSDVYAPVSGHVVEVNLAVVDNPALVNESPEERAWFVKMEMTSASETAQLLDAAAYKKHCETATEHH